VVNVEYYVIRTFVIYTGYIDLSVLILFLGADPVWKCGAFLVFQRTMLLPSSGLKRAIWKCVHITHIQVWPFQTHGRDSWASAQCKPTEMDQIYVFTWGEYMKPKIKYKETALHRYKHQGVCDW